MNSPLNRNVQNLFASCLRAVGTARASVSPRSAAVNATGRFAATLHRRDALSLVRQMEERGFSYEQRRCSATFGQEAALVSFSREREIYSALAASECKAICTAAKRFLERTGLDYTGLDASEPPAELDQASVTTERYAHPARQVA